MAAGPFGIIEVLAEIPRHDSEESTVVEPPELTLDLPLPPSINRTSGKRLGNEHWLVKAWRRQADAHLMATRQSRYIKLVKGTVSIRIIWDLQNLADIDNRIKYLLDYLQRLGIVTNDNKVRGLHIDYGVAPAGCRVIVRPTVWQS